VHDAFFTRETPVSVVKDLERLLSPYESMLWPLQALFRFVSGPDVISSIVGWRQGSRQARMLVLAAEKDVLCTPAISKDAAERYRGGWRKVVGNGVQSRNGGEDGVRFRVVHGLGHHLQNHVEWEKGAEEILEWVEGLDASEGEGSRRQVDAGAEGILRKRV
jgi:hypothetical protein